jgi:hypothetical protein
MADLTMVSPVLARGCGTIAVRSPGALKVGPALQPSMRNIG